MNTSSYQAQPLVHVQKFMSSVYLWMFAGFFVSSVIAWFAISSGLTQNLIPYMFILMLIKLAIVLGASFLLERMNATMTIFAFFAYAALFGITLSVVFLKYDLGSIFTILGVTAVTFGAMAIYGYTTQSDLSAMGVFLFITMIGVLILGIINFILGSDTLSTIISFVAIIIFAGFTAYDHQKIKETAMMQKAGTDDYKKLAVFGAFMLFIDFVMIFLNLLSLFGSSD